MGYVLGLALLCFAVWLLLSGHFSSPLLLGLGVLSSLLVAVMGWRMRGLNPEERPARLRPNPHLILYWPWLLWQIIQSNWDVMRRILAPELPISPTMIRMKLNQRSDSGKVIYANSITLTPGTVTTSLQDDYIEVHALTREAAEALREGEMSRRVQQLEGSA